MMADLYLQQAEADEMLYFLSLDYRLRDISRHNILPFSNILIKENTSSCGHSFSQKKKGFEIFAKGDQKEW